ncbi:MAG TPA: hypothetical protein VH117_12920, partial [Edaphobacter sp.]|nr:hypothetical protein [Edaphobacter sp.]
MHVLYPFDKLVKQSSGREQRSSFARKELQVKETMSPPRSSPNVAANTGLPRISAYGQTPDGL